MADLLQRAPTTVGLIGRAAEALRPSLEDAALRFSQRGPSDVCLADLRGLGSAIDEEIAEAERLAGLAPLVVVIGISDALPQEEHGATTLLRLPEEGAAHIAPVLRRVASLHRLGGAAAVRYRALTALGHPFPSPRVEGADAPVALLGEPKPDLLPILRDFSTSKIATPITSSHTLRLLEGNYASSLLIHLTAGLEHRLPVLKLIRRQSDLCDLPVAVVGREWPREGAEPWLDAGVDLLARPDEIAEVLTYLRSSTRRFRAQRAARYTLGAASVCDRGSPSPIHGRKLFDRVVAEHFAQGDRMAFGLIRLKPQKNCSEHDLMEAGVYLAMALAPLDLVCRPSEDLFLVAMPSADRHYAGKTMQTLRTLIEDLKFGSGPEPVLISSKIASLEGAASAAEALELLRRETGRTGAVGSRVTA